MRAQAQVIHLEASLREAQEERVRLHRATIEMKTRLEELQAAYMAFRDQSGADRPSSSLANSTKRRISVMRGQIANRDAKIKRLEKEIAERAMVDPRIEELGDELIRKNILLQHWREFAKELKSQGLSRRSEAADEQAGQPATETRPVSADSGKGSAEPSAGPSSGEVIMGGLAPHAAFFLKIFIVVEF